MDARWRRWFIRLCWLPPTLMTAMMWDLRRAEAWGAMALAAVYVPVLALVGGLFALAGGVLWRRARRARRHGEDTWGFRMAVLVASTPALILAARFIYLDLARGP